jgi:hypothetical protein
MRTVLIAMLVAPLASCASSGLYNMSDDWCATHQDATVARCPEKAEERRVAVNENEHAADGGNGVAAND